LIKQSQGASFGFSLRNGLRFKIMQKSLFSLLLSPFLGSGNELWQQVLGSGFEQIGGAADGQA